MSIPHGSWLWLNFYEIYWLHVYDNVFPIPKNAVVLDVGASVGVFSLYAREKIGDDGFIVMVEPDPESYNCLINNFEYNNIKNYYAINMAAWNKPRFLQLNVDEGNIGLGNTVMETFGRHVLVNADRLDYILSSLGYTNINFVKVDVEGAEIQVLEGLGNMLHKIDYVVVAAYHPQDNPAMIASFLEGFGFTVITKNVWFTSCNPYIYAYKK